MDKKILDVTCGARTIWFDKNHPAAIYCDKRREEYNGLWKNAGNCSIKIDPDVLCDFTALPFRDNSFALVVFDPPHLIGAKETAWLVKKYGKLDETWPQMLHDGFRECMRVLKSDGVLIFKWSEYDIPAERVWKAIGQKPLFGHHSGKKSGTFWGCFMKLEELPNAPLTLEELREMDGEPVWLKRKNSQYYDVLSGITKSGKVCFYTAELSLENYGKTWLAYRRKPEEVGPVPSETEVPDRTEHLRSRSLRKG